jgi:hypothetical protein
MPVIVFVVVSIQFAGFGTNIRLFDITTISLGLVLERCLTKKAQPFLGWAYDLSLWLFRTLFNQQTLAFQDRFHEPNVVVAGENAEWQV